MISIEDVKAKDFFKAFKHQDTSYLKHYNKDHQKLFENLYDEYFKHRDNMEAKSNLSKQTRLENLKLKHKYISAIERIYLEFPLKSEQREKIEKNLINLGYKLKGDDIKNKLARWKSELQNEINFLSEELKIKGGKADKFSFPELIVSFENVLERTIDENLTLAKFIAYEKTANEVIKKRNSKNNG